MPAQLNALCQIPRLYLAWNMVKAKGSVGGIDGISIIEFEKVRGSLSPIWKLKWLRPRILRRFANLG